MDPQRTPVKFFVLHHAVTPLWPNKSKAELAKWFSDTGFTRGYGGKTSNWSGLINPFTGERSYAQAHVVGQVVDDSTPDATPEEKALGYRIFPIVADIWDVITWGAGNWEVNRAAINIENLGDYRNYALSDGAVKAHADFWRQHDRNMKGDTVIVGHQEVSQTGTACPTRILERRDDIVLAVNQNPVPEPEPTPPSKAELVWKSWPIDKRFRFNKAPTNLWAFDQVKYADVKSVKQFNQGDTIDLVGEVYNKQLNATYYLTGYSFSHKIANGFNKVDLDEVLPIWGVFSVDANGDVTLLFESKVESEARKKYGDAAPTANYPLIILAVDNTELERKSYTPPVPEPEPIPEPEPEPQPEPQPEPEPEPEDSWKVVRKNIKTGASVTIYDGSSEVGSFEIYTEVQPSEKYPFVCLYKNDKLILHKSYIPTEPSGESLFDFLSNIFKSVANWLSGWTRKGGE